MLHFVAIPADFVLCLATLREDDFTIELKQGEMFLGIFYYIFRSSHDSDKNLHYPLINSILIHLLIKLQRKSVDLSPK